ncbi:spinster family MFS transporter [Thermoflexus sp.]|uniref:spinster family MFS transporter n=1 Tax=Thermoflexus sp. TaxID=1969742 RepID=UPI0025E63826|nr:MFS transporter [Thermoflexus sp.]MDW8179962.1 MFS transporter [Anaerolineae bacterium]MCS6962529.1 MFS transporter [Thermoflexus sp.]MCS7350511.1 MFS transporter [Thermoflexus sp.]MCX7690316.1 MFS transporter [Thermoflexus sp.]MDW8183632.1 MFS transporter [Anaerolineae bacterium]
MGIPAIAYWTLLVLFWANFLNFMDRQIIAALVPILRREWALSDLQLGLLNTAFGVIYALAPFPIAYLSDRWLRRRVIALAVAVWSGAMAWSSLALSYGMLLLGRAGLGLGQAGYGPSALAWLSDVFPPQYRSRAVGIHDLGVILGAAAGYGIGGVIGQALGWRTALGIAALPGFLLAALIWRMPEPVKGQSDLADMREQGVLPPPPVLPPLPTVRALLRIPTLRWTFGTGVLISFATGGMAYWLPSFAVRLHGFSPGEAGLLVGAITALTGAFGVLAGGFLADWWRQRAPGGRLRTVGLGFALGFLPALGALFAPDRLTFILLAALALFFYTFYFPCMGPIMHQVTIPTMRASAFGLYLLLVHILGNAPAPAIIGWLSDQTGSLQAGLLVAPLMALVGSALAFWGSRHVGEDERRMREQMRGASL